MESRALTSGSPAGLSTSCRTTTSLVPCMRIWWRRISAALPVKFVSSSSKGLPTKKTSSTGSRGSRSRKICCASPKTHRCGGLRKQQQNSEATAAAVGPASVSSREIDWSAPERQTRAVAEFLSSLDDEDSDTDRKLPKVISPTDPCSAWTAKANKRVQFGYGLNYMIDTGHAVIVDVEATPARTYDEVAATRTMIERTEEALGLKPRRLTADTAYGTGKLLAWLLGKGIAPHIPVWERYQRTDGMFPRTGHYPLRVSREGRHAQNDASRS